MTPICVALIRIGFVLLGQEDTVNYGPTAYPTPEAMCSPASAAPAPASPWTEISPLPTGGYYYPSPYAVPAGTPDATDASAPRCQPVEPSWTRPDAASAQAEDALVRELIQVLNNTKSKETFCLTLEVLTALKGDRKQAIPAILQNAERLKISRGMLKDADKLTPEQEVFADALRILTEGKGDIRPAGTAAARTPPGPPARSVAPSAPAYQSPAQSPDGVGFHTGALFRY